ncbi:GL16842 [Drosophila persimilis]|uniref:GL16842 n=1 Tax=Drosophila persimilis TaxID=7234 RepID=B4GI06_DROPE|nr:telomere-associated protein RIF1 [Drosophila persimilis]EDW36126.1 GL16842 [Drosophila persimilis]
MDIDDVAKAGEAYHTVQLSTKEVLAAGRRQNYCTMIDLLATSCKTTGLIGTSFTDNELVEFWLGDILPLMFDADRKIQNCAVAALAEALVALDVSVIHEATCWQKLRSDFIEKYTPLIGEMRDARNPNWHKIWTLLVQIMDEELLRGCTYINKFLAIVEMGFRNPDHGVRSEAFLCWRVLIKIFAAYDELASSKRLRLLLIPLRTSQSRSSHVSGIKLRVWWYLITCLHSELPKTFDNAVEHFLIFIFGGGPRGLATGLAHNYQSSRELALPCLVSLWNVDSSEPLQRLMRELRLEPLTQPSPLMSSEVLQQHWRPLLAAAVAGMKLLTQNDSTESEQLLLQLLMRNLCRAMFRLGIASFNIACCGEIESSLLSPDASGGRIVRAVFNTIASESLEMERVAGSDFLDVLEAYLKLCLKAKKEVPPAILQRCISAIYATDNIDASNQNEFRLLSSFAELLMQPNEEEDHEDFAVKLHVWRQVSQAMTNYLRDNSLEYRLPHNAALLDTWLLWPLQTCAAFAGRRVSNAFDSSFCDQWRQLVHAGQNAPDRKKFVGDLKTTLIDLLKSKDEPLFYEFFDTYVAAVLKLGLCKDPPLYKDVFGLLQAVFEHPTQQILEACLNTLRNVILDLRQNELMVVFDALKPTLSAGIQCWNKNKYEGSFLDEWKRSIQEKFRKLQMKTMANQLKDIFKGEDLFVIIPSVWSLNPEKLTDRQKERFAEKSDIPALYNDMSQSQDSNSIKPWTPKKVVIAKSKQGELAIAGKNNDEDNVIVISESLPIDEPAAIVVTPSRKVASSNSNPVATTEKNKFRKPRTLADPMEERVEEVPMRQTRKRAALREAQTQPPATPERQTRSPKKAQPQPLPLSLSSPSTSSAAVAKINIAKATPMQSEDLFPEVAATSSAEPEKSANGPETQLTPPDMPMEPIPSTQFLPGNSVEATPASETSPRKSSARLCNLNSPPDRKQTNNSTSPTLRPKPTGHLTGRGAQLINMIRNKKLDGGCGSISPYAPLSSRVQVTPARVLDRAEQLSTPTSELNELTGTDHTSTPIQAKDLLVFSKRLPSPSASPSVSILKRKLRCESIDDSMSYESPALKRKRVSFHDPPVSVTKEYLRDADESRSSKPKRCLLMDKIAQTSALKRRGRLDSIIEIEKFAHEQTARSATADKTLDKSSDVVEEDAFTTLKWNDSTTTAHNCTPSFHSGAASTGESFKEGREAAVCQDVAILDTDKALDLLVSRCSLETVLQRYFDEDTGSTLKSAGIVAKFLSSQMSTNDKLKTNVLETLSENYSKDFLDHAVRENLSSVVCDRLNLQSVLDYICAKSKINNNCRSSLLAQIPDILKSDTERLALVQQLLLQWTPSDDQLFDLINHLIRSRSDRNTSSCSVAVGSPDNVAETAADSSSNL